MPENSATDTATGDKSSPFSELRIGLNAHFFHTTRVLNLTGAKKPADGLRDLRRQAALFALDNFATLRDSALDCITEEGLYNLLRTGPVDPATQPLLSLLYKEVGSIGHAIGVTRSTTHVAANGAAMPITFSRLRYGIDAYDLFQLIIATAKPHTK